MKFVGKLKSFGENSAQYFISYIYRAYIKNLRKQNQFQHLTILTAVNILYPYINYAPTTVSCKYEKLILRYICFIR